MRNTRDTSPFVSSIASSKRGDARSVLLQQRVSARWSSQSTQPEAAMGDQSHGNVAYARTYDVVRDPTVNNQSRN